MIAISPADAGRISTVVCILGVCVVWVLFAFAAWLNDGLDAARREYDQDRAEHDESIRAMDRVLFEARDALAHDDEEQWIG